MGSCAMNNDNWGERARLGLFIVDGEAVPEAEWWAMRPPGVSIHAARITARTPWAAWNDARDAVIPGEDLARGCRQFARMPLQAVVTAHTSSSIVGGPGWDEAAVAAMQALLRDGTQATTSGLDTAAGLRAVGSSRPFIVLPPWFGDGTRAAAEHYYGALGFAPVSLHRYEPGGSWDDVPPEQRVAAGLGFEQPLEPLLAQIGAHCPVEADGILIAGTGFRCVGLIDTLEETSGRPVVTANQASLWRGLRLAGLEDRIAGYGRLLTLP